MRPPRAPSSLSALSFGSSWPSPVTPVWSRTTPRGASSTKCPSAGKAAHQPPKRLHFSKSVADFRLRPLHLDGQRTETVLAGRAIARLGGALERGCRVAERLRAHSQRTALESVG